MKEITGEGDSSLLWLALASETDLDPKTAMAFAGVAALQEPPGLLTGCGDRGSGDI